MNVRSERVKTRQQGGGFLNKLGNTVSQVVGNLGDPQDNSPVTGSGAKGETIIVNDETMDGMKKYLPFIIGGVILFFLMKKGR